MATLIILIFIATAVTSISLVISNLSDMQAARLDTASIRPEISAAIQNADPSQMMALCARYPESALGRVAKDVFAKSDLLPADEATRSELLRMLLDHALAREAERATRATNLLRTIGIICIPLGLMATISDIELAIAPLGWRNSQHLAPLAAMASAAAYTTAGLLLSLSVLALYKYLKTRRSTALSELDDSCSELLAAFLSRPTGREAQRRVCLTPPCDAEPGQGSPILTREHL